MMFECDHPGVRANAGGQVSLYKPTATGDARLQRQRFERQDARPREQGDF